ncbi:MAG: CPBP family intramembrane metalloprotease [Phycisphaerales bacterium]|nr:CPBP family intramembrane metalloprotease [Phycisphaerales bacterium]
MLDRSHYTALYAAYAVAMAGALIAGKIRRRSWPASVSPTFARPWRELGYAMFAAICVIGVGQLYQAGIRLTIRGGLAPIFESINQLLIFSPMIVLLILRRHSPATAWLPLRNVGAHVVTGILLAAVAVLVFTVVRSGTAGWPVVVGRLVHPKNVDILVQVFLEDFSIAVILVRVGAALRRPMLAALLVAALFAAGHIPAMLSGGATAGELARLLLDFGLGAFVLLTVQRTGSIWWLVWIHYAMDMMQFDRIVGPAATSSAG